MIIHQSLTKYSIYMLESLMWFYDPPTKVIVLGGIFTVEFGNGHN